MTIESAQAEQFRQRYLADQIETATPIQRLIMLFDYLCRDLESARLAFVASDLKGINDSLVHAQQIILALRDPLDLETAFGKSLSDLYSFCIDRLIESNLNKDLQPLEQVQPLIEQIARANRAASVQAAEALSYAG